MEWNDIIDTVRDLLTTTLFQLQQTQVTLLSLIIFFLFLAASITLGRIVKNILKNQVFKRMELDEGLTYTLSRVTYYVIVTIGVLISFQFVGIDLSSLAVVFGLLSVGIGFGLQNITSNFISGLIVLFERPISVGDRVEVAGIEGDVLEINIRSTKIKTLNNITIIVPNQDFVASSVVNYSHGDPSFRLDIDVGVSYASNLDTVLKALDEVALEHPKVMKNPKHKIHFESFGDSAWNFKLKIWVPDVKDYRDIRNEINQMIVRKFREHHIEIPFPQRDVHLIGSQSS